MAAHFVDDRSGVVLLLLRRKPCAVIENKSIMFGRALALLGLRDRRDELRGAAGFESFLRGLPILIKFPVPRRAIIRGVENRVIKEWVGHGQYLLALLAMLMRIRSTAAIVSSLVKLGLRKCGNVL